MKLQRHEHYYTKIPKSKKKKYEINAAVEGVQLKLVAASGVFSPKKIDAGTLALIHFMQFRKGDKILDLGCGYGAIGVAAAKFCPSCTIVMTDINERAVWCSKVNIKINNLQNATAKQSHFFAALKDEMFDVILLNPPQSAGLDICYQLITEATEHLSPGGSLQIVARKRKGGTRLADKMEELLGNLEILGKKSGYWVYKSVKE